MILPTPHSNPPLALIARAGRWTPCSYPMEPQFRTRGIYRANAQRLSISLAPLVAQRSLLFRVKADLATKTSYAQMTPTTDESESDSDDLFVMTASVLSAVLSIASAAAVVSAAVLSAASVYSQESWKGPHSPFGFVPQMLPAPSPVPDTRRHAIAFSPSLRWSRLSESDMVDVPLSSALSHSSETYAAEPGLVSKGLGSLVTYLPAAMQVALPPGITVTKADGVQNGKAHQLKAKKRATGGVDEQSLRSKAFSDLMSRISLPSSSFKKEPTTPDPRRKTTLPVISEPLPQFNLAELKPIEQFTTAVGYKLPELKTPGPIRVSFIVGRPPAVPVPVNAGQKECATDADTSTTVLFPGQGQLAPADRPRPPRARPPPSLTKGAVAMSRPRPITLAPVTTAPDAVANARKMGHRRNKSSPAVMDFAFREQEERKEAVPPVPPVPKHLPPPLKLAPAPRARAHSTAGRTPPARATAMPLPGSRSRYGSL